MAKRQNDAKFCQNLGTICQLVVVGITLQLIWHAQYNTNKPIPANQGRRTNQSREMVVPGKRYQPMRDVVDKIFPNESDLNFGHKSASSEKLLIRNAAIFYATTNQSTSRW
ncbi:hypothetical protein M8J76_009451 [Diaphorina citri]|nr:hypothetical protein M8J76_009451 [Diaphorina citri]